MARQGFVDPELNVGFNREGVPITKCPRTNPQNHLKPAQTSFGMINRWPPLPEEAAPRRDRLSEDIKVFGVYCFKNFPYLELSLGLFIWEPTTFLTRHGVESTFGLHLLDWVNQAFHWLLDLFARVP